MVAKNKTINFAYVDIYTNISIRVVKADFLKAVREAVA